MLVGALAIGVALRLNEYLHDHALFYDEAALALNIAQRELGDLLSPLDYHQAAPLGFLVSVKLTALAIGYSEPALRLIPLLAGLACLPLMYWTATNALGREQALVAVALLALNTPSIIYATEFKQYGLDLLVALVLLNVMTRWNAAASHRQRSASILLAGTVAVWISHPAVLYEQDSRWPSQREELRATLGMLDDRWRVGDSLLVHEHALPAYRYYRELRLELWGQSLPAKHLCRQRNDQTTTTRRDPCLPLG